MSEEEAILSGLNESEAEGMLEIYVRMNGDCEKDYCFSISVTDRFTKLHDIFATLPLSLRPSLLYHSKPRSFQISTQPGYLTRDGGLLHAYDADLARFLKRVDQEERIADHVWPGQLIIPEWEKNTLTQTVLLSVLGLWLYSDLPDFLSPTPGLCLTTQMTRLVAYGMSLVGQTKMAESLLAEVYAEVGITGQCLFFAFHLFKLAMIVLVVWGGMYNPYRSTGAAAGKKVQDLTREELLAIGWTGSRHATIDEYRTFFKDHRVKKHGGIVAASQAGVFRELATMGILLGPGEGFDTPVTEAAGKVLLEAMGKREKFVLNYAYLAALGETFESELDELDDPNAIMEAVRNYRRYGPLLSSQTIHELYLQRKLKGDGEIFEAEAT